MRSFLFALAAVSVCAAPAAAQAPSKAFANINFGYQAQSQDLVQSGDFSLYDEIGSFEASSKIEGGPFFEFGGGYMITKNFGIGASYAMRSNAHRDAAVTALVPSPIFTDTLRGASATAAGLEHKEQAFHIQAMWLVPVTVDFDVTLFAGPTFFNVEANLIESITPEEVGGDFSQVNLALAQSSQKESAVGFNVGIDTRYRIMSKVGVGALVRYTKGSVDLTSPTGGDPFKLDTGGLEIAAGLRFRF